MAKLTILEFPDPRLRTKAAPVEQVDDEIRQLIDDMFETMYEAPGIGLAATQVNVHKRVVVIDVTEDRSQPIVLINPEILTRQGTEETEEGCLSVPGIYDKVTRSEKIQVRTLDRNGKLTIDSAMLTSALERSHSDVKALFGEIGKSMYRASDSIAASYGGTVSSQIRFLEESNAALADRIGDAEARLEVRRQSLIQQYTRMETMLSQVQSQGSWLTQQIQSLNGSGQ